MEDEPEQSDPLARLLLLRGLDPWVAASFTEGLACAAAHEFTCIVLDLGLPDTESPMDTLRRASEFGSVPIVVLTGHADSELLRECSKLHAGYELKPVNLYSLLPKILLRIEAQHPSAQLEEEIIATAREHPREPVIQESTAVSMSVGRVIALVIAIVTATITLTSFVLTKVGAVDANVSTIRTMIENTTAANAKRLDAIDAALKAAQTEREKLDRWRWGVSRDIRSLGDSTKTPIVTPPDP